MAEERVIPETMQRLRRWLVWRHEERNGRKTKVPYQATLRGRRPASSTDERTWSSYVHARYVQEKRGFDGVGFVFAPQDDIVGVDLDGVRDPKTGVLEPWAEEIVRLLDSFTEISPSGKGLHIYVRGTIPGPRRRKGKVEVYDQGRFFTVTGWHLPGTPLEVRENPEGLAKVYRRFLHDEKPPEPVRHPPVGPHDLSLSDEEVLERMFRSKNGPRYRALWEGRWQELGYPSQSEADLAFAAGLAFFTGGDLAQMDRLFRRSGLMRDKWDRSVGQGETYGQRTLKRALG